MLCDRILEAQPDINQRIAERVRALRAERGFSLEVLAAESGVSRSMISLIERGESSPTAVVLDKLAVALGVTLASLFNSSGEAAARQKAAEHERRLVPAVPAFGERQPRKPGAAGGRYLA